MSLRRILVCLAVAVLAVLWLAKRPVAADDWQPIDSADLKMTSEPKAPGAPAIFLYRQVDRNDSGNSTTEFNYARIKILTEEGRKYGDVEIPFNKENENISNIRARTIHPDGSVASFDGKVYEKTVVKAKGLKYLVKTFSMPDVTVGSIVEYRFNYDFKDRYIFNSRWILSAELFTRLGKFSLKPYQEPPWIVQWVSPARLPAGTDPAKKATVGNVSEWHLPFQYQYSIQASNYAKAAGDLLLVRPRVLGHGSSDLLEKKEPRRYPVEFEGPEKNVMTYDITLPQGYVVDELPTPVDAGYSFGSYHAKTVAEGNVLKYTRTLEIKQVSVPLGQVEDLKKFYRIIASDERNNAVLKPAGAH